MPGPYFEGQQPAACGCYYPDVTRFRDDFFEKSRTLFCINHGWIALLLAGHEMAGSSTEVQPVPADEWREKERSRLRNGKHCKEPGCDGYIVPNNFVSLQVGGCSISNLGFYCDICHRLYRWDGLEPIFKPDGRKLFFKDGKVVTV